MTSNSHEIGVANPIQSVVVILSVRQSHAVRCEARLPCLVILGLLLSIPFPSSTFCPGRRCHDMLSFDEDPPQPRRPHQPVLFGTISTTSHPTVLLILLEKLLMMLRMMTATMTTAASRAMT